MNEPNFEFPALREAQGKLDEARKRLATVFSEAGPDMDMDNVKALSGSREEKVEQIRRDNEEINDLKGKVDGLQGVARAAAESSSYERERGSDSKRVGGQPEHKSFGEAFTENISNLREQKGRAHELEGVELKDLFQTSDGWEPESVRSGRVELAPLRPSVHVVQHIPSGTINQPLYKFMQETVHDASGSSGTTAAGGAVGVPEGTGYGQSALELTEQEQAVRKIATWLPVTDEQLEDEPAARAYVEQRLGGMVRAKLDSQVLLGDNSSSAPSELLGTTEVTGIQTQGIGSDTLLDALYKLFTSIRSDGFAEPSVTFMHPSRWQSVQLLKTADGQYIWGHPSSTGPMTAWGVPVVQTTALSGTQVVTGDYANYSMLFSRRGLELQVTNSHDDFFVNGKQAFRADLRAVMVHFRPGAFGEITGLS